MGMTVHRPHVRFDERRRETERLAKPQAAAPFFDSTIPDLPRDPDPSLTLRQAAPQLWLASCRQHPRRSKLKSPVRTAGWTLGPIADQPTDPKDLAADFQELVRADVDRDGPSPGRPVVLALRTHESGGMVGKVYETNGCRKVVLIRHLPGVVGPSAINSSVSEADGARPRLWRSERR